MSHLTAFGLCTLRPDWLGDPEDFLRTDLRAVSGSAFSVVSLTLAVLHPTLFCVLRSVPEKRRSAPVQRYPVEMPQTTGRTDRMRF
ncbi:hypothetical protein D3C87_2051400 [compost metagenome]